MAVLKEKEAQKRLNHHSSNSNISGMMVPPMAGYSMTAPHKQPLGGANVRTKDTTLNLAAFK
jgi:hypothetical protein